ncbi:MAG: hypothetical protein WCS03_01270 [Bacteroidota bacterium]
MDFNATIDLIIKDLKEAAEIIDDLKKYPGVPVLQVELAKSKCKSAGEVIALLKSLRDNVPVAIIPPHVVITTPVIITPPPVEKKEESKKIPQKVSESSILADKFHHLSSINEELGGNKSDDDVTDFLKAKPFTSLSEAIGLNDKFLFIREIFNGNKDSYAQAISRLDNAESLTDARAVIMSYTGKNIENVAVKQLLSLVKRKLSSHE